MIFNGFKIFKSKNKINVFTYWTSNGLIKSTDFCFRIHADAQIFLMTFLFQLIALTHTNN